MDKETLIAIARLVLSIALPAITAAGISVDVDAVYTVIGAVASIVAIAYAWWKNENITEAAKQAQKVLDELKAGN